jgi:hypothetical protein
MAHCRQGIGGFAIHTSDFEAVDGLLIVTAPIAGL